MKNQGENMEIDDDMPGDAPSVGDHEKMGGEGSPGNPQLEELKKEIENARLEIEKKEQAAKESHERYLRTLADFENYRKRTQKEQMEQAKFANEKLIKEFLPVIDNLERALASSKDVKEVDRIVQGVELIYKQLLSVLGKFGVMPIESLHRPFDPFLHQSIGQVEMDLQSGEEENQVVGESQKGYFLNERVLRPSMVMVSKKKSAPSEKGSS